MPSFYGTIVFEYIFCHLFQENINIRCFKIPEDSAKDLVKSLPEGLQQLLPDVAGKNSGDISACVIDLKMVWRVENIVLDAND